MEKVHMGEMRIGEHFLIPDDEVCIMGGPPGYLVHYI